MNPAAIIFILIFLIIGIVLYKIVKKVVKVIFILSILLIAFMTISFLFVYLDFKDVKENINSEKAYIIEDRGTIISGMLINGNISQFSQEQIAEYHTYLNNKEYKKILGDNYKMFIIKTDVIQDLEEPIDFGKFSLSRQAILSVLRSAEPAKELSSQLGEGAMLTLEDQEAKDLISLKIIEEVTGNQLVMLSEFKKGNVIIYPETAIFKFVKVIPVSFVKSIAKKAFEKAKEEATEKIS